MENRLKLQLSRMFRRASLGSCRTRNLPDVIEEAVFVPQNQTPHFHVFEQPPPSPKPRHFPSICKPQTGPRQKVSDRYYSRLGFADNCGSSWPPVSPISPFLYYKKERKNKNNERSGSKLKSKKKKKSLGKSTSREERLFSSSSRYNSGYYSWFSSDDDDDDDKETDTHTLFSSRSTTLSSDSSGSIRLKMRSSRRRGRRERVGSRSSEIGDSNALPLMEEGRVKDSFAVVKKSSDPHNDFRTSMVEMIVEKQIFGAKDLEKLLQLFLFLNSECHHRIIVEVFTEILETLFSDWS